MSPPNPESLRWAVRLSAPLDGYVPLEGSLDPARRAPLPAAVRQVHLVGDEDENVPPALVAAVAARQPAARVLTLAGYDHRCCWADSWPALLQAVLAPVE